MNDTVDNAPLEVMAPSAMMAIERAQIDSQVATAKQYPRELAKFKQRAMQMATLDGETAESCVYCRPVGKDERGKQKFAEGPSIRMAEIVATCYGNIRVAARIVEQTPRYVICEGACHDLETNFAAKAEAKESTVDRNGNPYSERQGALIAKVCLSKAMRDAIFRVVPRALMKPVLDECKKVINKQTATIEQRIQRVQSWVASLKIDEKRFFAAVGVTGWVPTEFTVDIFEAITGLKTAISEGGDGNTIDDIFPPVENANAPAATSFQKAAQATNPPAQGKAPAKAAEPAKETKAAPARAAEKAPEPAKEPAAAAPAVAEKTAEQQEADELAKMGLAPEPDTNAQADAEAAAQEAAPAAGADDKFVPKEGEDEKLVNLRRVMFAEGKPEDRISEAELLKYTLSVKLSKPEQKTLGDLASSKLEQLTKAWAGLLPKIKAALGRK